MQSVYDNVKNHVIKLIVQYRYDYFKGPLTGFNLSTLIEISSVVDTSKIYHILNKPDMEIRINRLSRCN